MSKTASVFDSGAPSEPNEYLHVLVSPHGRLDVPMIYGSLLGWPTDDLRLFTSEWLSLCIGCCMALYYTTVSTRHYGISNQRPNK